MNATAHGSIAVMSNAEFAVYDYLRSLLRAMPADLFSPQTGDIHDPDVREIDRFAISQALGMPYTDVMQALRGLERLGAIQSRTPGVRADKADLVVVIGGTL